jgi:hypothetical protein
MWMQLWAIKGKRFSATGILSEEGEAPVTVGDSISNLLVRWTPVVHAKQGDKKLADKFASFLNYQQLDDQWVMGYEQFVEVMSFRKSTAPGPDGIAHCFWWNGPDQFRRVLFDLYYLVFAFGRITIWF